MAQRIARFKTDYDLAFVVFGAEQRGLIGSNYFANHMSQADRDRTIVMIDFDALIFGDMLSIHAGANAKTWAHDEMVRLIRLRKLPSEMQPGLNPEYAAGLTSAGFGDYAAFNGAGTAIVDPDRPMERLNAYTRLVFELLKRLNP